MSISPAASGSALDSRYTGQWCFFYSQNVNCSNDHTYVSLCEARGTFLFVLFLEVEEPRELEL